MFDNFSFSNIWENDGILISVVGYVVVFAALLLLSIVISNLKRILQFKQRKELKEIGHNAADIDDLSISGEVSAAISAALYLYFEEKHDLESTVITMKRVQKTYSPWSSKLYGLQHTPRRQGLK